jgi:AhpD family alkylhydroperoxidase
MSIKPFKQYTEITAPDGSKEMLRNTIKDFGMIPNLESVMAGAPTLLSSYNHCWEEFKSSSLSAIEQQVVYLTINFENNCEYCVPWHTMLSQQAKMPATEIQNLRDGCALQDKKLNELHQFTKSMVRTRGAIAPADLQAFKAAGYTDQQALEVVLGVATKVMSNYTNALAQTPLDEEVSSLRWKKPSLRNNEEY